jgi:hypothetical protein
VSNPRMAKSYNAEAAISAYTIVKPGANDLGVVHAAAVGDSIIGVTTEVAADSGAPTDIIHSGIAFVKLGGTVTRGDILTSDANGNAVTAAPAAGTNNRTIGIARVSGVVGDVAEVLIRLGTFQG